MNQPKLRGLIEKAQDGDREALLQLVERFMPLIKKYGHGIPDDEASLIVKIAEAAKRYQPNTRWGRDELDRSPEKDSK